LAQKTTPGPHEQLNGLLLKPEFAPPIGCVLSYRFDQNGGQQFDGWGGRVWKRECAIGDVGTHTHPTPFFFFWDPNFFFCIKYSAMWRKCCLSSPRRDHIFIAPCIFRRRHFFFLAKTNIDGSELKLSFCGCFLTPRARAPPPQPPPIFLILLILRRG
jgi:hypothetical protein